MDKQGLFISTITEELSPAAPGGGRPAVRLRGRDGALRFAGCRRGETATLLTPFPPSVLKRLLQGEAGAAE